MNLLYVYSPYVPSSEAMYAPPANAPTNTRRALARHPVTPPKPCPRGRERFDPTSPPPDIRNRSPYRRALHTIRHAVDHVSPAGTRPGDDATEPPLPPARPRPPPDQVPQTDRPRPPVAHAPGPPSSPPAESLPALAARHRHPGAAAPRPRHPAHTRRPAPAAVATDNNRRRQDTAQEYISTVTMNIATGTKTT